MADMQHIRGAALTLMLLLLQKQQALSRPRTQLLLMYFLFRRRNEIYSAAAALKLKARPIRRWRRFWAIRRPQLLFEHKVINRMLDCTWKEHFRVDRSTFFYIVCLIDHRLRKQNNQFRDAIPVDKRVPCSLWRLGTGECYGSLGEQFGAGCKTADEINLDFLYTIFEHYHQFIHFPDSEQEIQTAIGKYGELSQIPQVYLLTYLAIDGTYIKIKSPDDDLDDYIFAERGIIAPFSRQL